MAQLDERGVTWAMKFKSLTLLRKNFYMYLVELLVEHITKGLVCMIFCLVASDMYSDYRSRSHRSNPRTHHFGADIN